MKSLMMFSVTVVFVMLIFGGNTFACQCQPSSISTDFLRADSVFIGKLSKVQKIDYAWVGFRYNKIKSPLLTTSAAQILTFEVTESLKGVSGEKIVMFKEATYCSTSFPHDAESIKDNIFLVFAYNRPTTDANDVGTRGKKDKWTRLLEEADRINQALPPLQIGMCDATSLLSDLKAEEQAELLAIQKSLKN